MTKNELQAEVDRLRAVIENAPHGEMCQARLYRQVVKRPCTCWKADAL